MAQGHPSGMKNCLIRWMAQGHPSAMKNCLIGGMASLERDNLVVFYYLSASVFWPDERGGIWCTVQLVFALSQMFC